MGDDRPPLRFFRSPSAVTSPDVHRVWLDCCLPEISEMNDILWALDTWARLNCRIEMRQHHHLGYELPYLFWLSPSGVRHECFADTYSRWFICGCIEVTAVAPEPQPVIVPLNLPQEITPEPLGSLTEEEENLLDQLSDEESAAVDRRLEEIRIHSLADEKVETFTMDDISHFELERFLSTSTLAGTPRYDSAHSPFHSQTTQ